MKKMTIYAGAMPMQHTKKHAAVYCRVSTDSRDQKHSYNAQKLYFTRLLKNSADYELVDIYADLGLSGTSNNRPEFMRLLDDCRQGKIDRVMCKSISRFARNTKDCLTALRELKRLGITVAFEKEGIDTAVIADEIMITIMEGLAQEESRSISNNVRWSLQKRMSRGTLNVARVPYGYKKDKRRNLIIDEKKAAVVRRIFELYLSGSGFRRIAVLLSNDNIPSPTGKQWNAITIKKILKQEKYIGDIRWQKTYSVFMGEHDKINDGNADSYYISNSHPAIIDREAFEKVQELMEQTAEKTKPKNAENNEKNADRIDSIFRGKIKCTCGRSYYRVKAVNNYWQCVGRSMLGAECDNNIVYDFDLQNAWNRMCLKLKSHSDEILTPVLIQVEMAEEAVQGKEISVLEVQGNELRQRRYMLCRLFSEGCITLDKKLESENEIEKELTIIGKQIEKITSSADDTAEQIETLIKAVRTVPTERLAEVILDRGVIDGKSVTFHLIGGLKFKEKL